MQKLWMSCFVAAILVLNPAIAGENSFENNSSGIIDNLLAAPTTAMQPIYKTRGLSKPTQQEGYKIRGLRLEKKWDGTQEYKLIEINKSDRDRASKVNLEIQFDVNSAKLRPKSTPLLDELAKAGSTSRYPWGNEFDVSKANNNRSRTVPVGSYGANNFGVHDTAGNVWEWVGDCWHYNYSGAPIDGSAWTSGGDCSQRVLRGGSWVSGPWILRSANRFKINAPVRYNNSGIRIARTLSR